MSSYPIIQPNHYAGDCERPGCHQWVEIGQGQAKTFGPDDRWNLYHRDGQCPPPPPPAATRLPRGRLLDCGHYATESMTTAQGTACPDCYDRLSD